MTEAIEAIRSLREHGVFISVNGETIRVSYRCPASELSKVKDAIATLRAHKQEAIALLQALPRCWHCGSKDGEAGRCDCITCGAMAAQLIWKAGPCRVCRARQEQQMRVQ